MTSLTNLAGKTIFITGGSRGIGRSIALRAARDGAKIVIAAKTAEPHPKLPGTIYTVASEIEKAGGEALACAVDIRFDDQVQKAIDRAVKTFGGIDILVNNASAISLTNTQSTEMKTYDLMMDINARGSFMCSKFCVPYLKKSPNPHILTLSPPLNMFPKWFSNHLAYSMSKYAMSMTVLGMAKELQPLGIAVNALWPRTAIYTSATKMIGGGEDFASFCRQPEIMADAAYAILTRPAKETKNTGNFFVDDDVLREQGVTDFEKYAIKPGGRLAPDFFLEPEPTKSVKPPPGSDCVPPSVDEIFRKIEAFLSEGYAKGVGASFFFTLSGSQPGTWFVDLRSDKGAAGRATGDRADPMKFDCRLNLTSENFGKLFCGQMSPSRAFLAGDLEIAGDVFLATKLEKFLKDLIKKMG
ncbi:Hydroxysteroid dehydrogenase like protein 2 [Fasciola hepatica]|uniref:Hydroxysteroid dehydrogenase-like protein 2 n=1 Tax=Fasciola hepatica TaxID=6192 RepID=A0A4E0RWP0_FASHE|nr:Hydroxysteroid dehydrogenase like protein 2 [Fasciola hepatica]